jgi:hypothetical protein
MMSRSAALVLLACAACSSDPHAFAGRVQSPADLVGGPRAIGDVGDWRLSNGRVRFIVQDKGQQRVYGTFGGSLIDADLARPAELDPRGRPIGKDGLGELFPAYFLSALEPSKIEVIDDGSSGGTARLRVSGKQSEFLTSTKLIDALTIGNGLSFVLDYALGPQDDFLTITSSVVNEQAAPHLFLSSQYPIAMGFIGLFGDGQPLFVPGEAGYDVRFSLEKAYKRTYTLPAFGGITTSALTVEGDGISYGMSYCSACESPLRNGVKQGDGFVWHHRDQYRPYDAQLNPDSMLVPFISGTLFGLFLGEAPPVLEGGRAFSTTMKLRISDGSPAHLIDSVHQDRGDSTVLVSGVVREERSEAPLPFADVIFQRGSAYETSARADAQGRFFAQVRQGHYRVVGRSGSRPDSPPVEVDVFAAGAFVEPHVGRNGFVAVEVADGTGRAAPAKVTLDRAITAKELLDPRAALYDLHLGDPYRPTNLDPQDPRMLETTARALDGHADLQARPGHYRCTVSRGPAYSIDQQEIEVVAGQLTRVSATLSRVLPALGRVAADLHVHAQGSVDSDVSLPDRAASYAAEGIDFLAMTEHNYVEDLQPVIDAAGLTDFLKATVGIELTSLEAGHWNAYPLAFDAGSVTHGSFPWFRRTPQELFDDLRAHGKYSPEDTVVQVNHPRDAIQGYFNAYGVTGDELTGVLSVDAPGKSGTFSPSGAGFGPGTFSLDFDAIEILTGKRFDLLHTFHVPDPNPEPCTGPSPRPVCKLAPGVVVRDSTGLVAYPGAAEDWEHLLDLNRRVTAVGNSDSHKLLDGEAGYPRNLIDVGHDVSSARALDDREVARAIKAGRVQVTTGPELTLTAVTPAGEVPVGSLVRPDAAGKVQLHVVVQAAPWVDVSRVLLFVPGPAGCFRGDACSRIQLTVPPSFGNEVRRLDTVVPVSVPAGRDSWIAAEAWGDKSLWPVVIPYEIPTLLLTDAVGTVGAALGLPDEFGALKPTQQTQMKPYALSNAIYVDGNGDGKWGGQAVPAAAKAPLSSVGQGDSARLVDLRAALH